MVSYNRSADIIQIQTAKIDILDIDNCSYIDIAIRIHIPLVADDIVL